MNPACNIWCYSIFFMDNFLFAFFEYFGSDFDIDMAKMTSDVETQCCCGLVKPLMEPLKTMSTDESCSNMEEIFHLS